MRADHKLHQRAKTPKGWRADKVQARHGAFEPRLEPRIAMEATYRCCEFWGKEIVLGNIHSISGSQKNMVSGSLASVI
jgi:hypothetical protein